MQDDPSTHLPEFPNFRQFVLSDRDWYSDFTLPLRPYADYNFNTLMVWFNKTGELQASSLNNNVVFRYPDVLNHSNATIYSFNGTTDINASLLKVLHYLKDKALEPKLDMVPEDTVEKITDDQILVEEDADNSEYILDCNSIYELPGKDYRSLREDRNSFQNRYQNIEKKVLDLNEGEISNLIHDSYIEWAENNTHKSNDPEKSEREVIDSILTNAKYLDYRCLGIFVDNKLVSFVLYHYPSHKDFISPSVIKINYDYQDVFDYTVNAFAELVHNEVKFINFEQDLGIEGLRKYKSSLKPINFLKKYTVSLK